MQIFVRKKAQPSASADAPLLFRTSQAKKPVALYNATFKLLWLKQAMDIYAMLPNMSWEQKNKKNSLGTTTIFWFSNCGFNLSLLLSIFMLFSVSDNGKMYTTARQYKYNTLNKN